MYESDALLPVLADARYLLALKAFAGVRSHDLWSAVPATVVGPVASQLIAAARDGLPLMAPWKLPSHANSHGE